MPFMYLESWIPSMTALASNILWPLKPANQHVDSNRVLLSLEAELNTYERDMDDYMARWSADLKTMEEEPASAAKDQRIQDNLANQHL